MQWRLRDNLYAARLDGHTVFLDVRRDRYFLASRRLHSAFGSVADQGESDDDDALAPLIQRGYLEPALDSSLIAKPIPFERSMSLRSATSVDPPFDLVLVAIFEQLRTAVLLKFLPLHRIVDDLQRLKGSGRGRAISDSDALVRAAAFRRSAKYMMSDQKCLRRSIALAHHLLRRGHQVSMHFGVSVRPFHAHCWVQKNDLVLNNTADEVQPYTPILVI